MIAGGEESRGKWSSQFGFILAATGSAVGLGNIWKFPFVTHQNGGGAFVLVYLICILLVGFPIMVAEIFMGKQTGRDPVGAFRRLKKDSKLWPLAGYIGVVAGFSILSYYSVVSGWVLHYVLIAFKGTLSGYTGAESAEYFQNFVQQTSLQLGYHFSMMLVFTGIVTLGIKNGIERANKIFMPLLFIMLLILMGYSMAYFSGREAFEFLFNWENYNNLSSHGILEALGHSFFTLSLGMGAMITYGSYMTDQEHVMPGSIWIVIADVVISIMACFLIYSILFSFDEEVGGGPGLLFITLPGLIEKITGSFLCVAGFFILVLFAAISSAISLLEVVVAFCIDELKVKRTTAVSLSAVTIFLLGIPSALSFNGLSDWLIWGRNFFDWIDYVASNWLLPFGGLSTALFVGWVVDREVTEQEVSRRWRFLFRPWRFVLHYITPILVILVILKTTGIWKI